MTAYQKYINGVKCIVKAISIKDANQQFDKIKKGESKISVTTAKDGNRSKKKKNTRHIN